jgi:hypothetical protein
MKKLIATIGLACGLALSAVAGNFYGYNNNGGYTWGDYNNQTGNWYQYGNNGAYSWGHVNQNGNWYQYGNNGGYSWGRINPH